LLATSALVAAAAFSGAAAAGSGPPSPAIKQYMELLPTASGSQPSKTGQREAAIPAATQKAIARSGASAPLLKKVVASQGYGAPPTFSAGRHDDRIGRPSSVTRSALPAAPGAASAGLGAFGGTGLVFVIVLGLTLLGAALLRFRRG
jgi:hypothetical protein